MRKSKFFFFLAVMALVMGSFSYSVQAAEPTNVDVTARIDAGTQFWTSFYSKAFGEEETITLYRIKSVVVEIKSGSTVLDSFTFTRAGEQTHRFLLTTPLPNIVIQYRANTFTDYSFNYTFPYLTPQTILIGNSPTQLNVKAPFFTFTK